MHNQILTVNYTFVDADARLRATFEDLIEMIAGVRGLRWKLWGMDPANGVGTSAYCFADADSAEAFVNGPLVEAFRAHPAIRSVSFVRAPIDTGLSLRTGAAGLFDHAPETATFAKGHTQLSPTPPADEGVSPLPGAFSAP